MSQVSRSPPNIFGNKILKKSRISKGGKYRKSTDKWKPLDLLDHSRGRKKRLRTRRRR